MWDALLPIIPAVAAGHAWMTFMLLRTFGEQELSVLPPEAFPI